MTSKNTVSGLCQPGGACTGVYLAGSPISCGSDKPCSLSKCASSQGDLLYGILSIRGLCFLSLCLFSSGEVPVQKQLAGVIDWRVDDWKCLMFSWETRDTVLSYIILTACDSARSLLSVIAFLFVSFFCPKNLFWQPSGGSSQI